MYSFHIIHELGCEKTGLRGLRLRSDTNRSVQLQMKVRILKIWVEVEEEFYYPRSKNKGADQLRRSAPLFSPRQKSSFLMTQLT